MEIMSYPFPSLARRRCHDLFTDMEINSSFIVHLNIYENFLIMAMKMVKYLKEWNPEMPKSAEFILSTLKIARV